MRRTPRVKGLCVDCGGRRMVRRPGPRCGSCEREKKAQASAKAHAARIEETYGITAEEYWAIYEAQGRRCEICRRATGKTRRLSVDHDHKTGEVRGLLCRPCNTFLGHIRDSKDSALALARYLEDPPARQVLTPRDWSCNLK